VKLTCSECGSDKLIWDYARGDIICSSCGLVVDRIYCEHTVLHGGFEDKQFRTSRSNYTAIKDASKRVANYERLKNRFKLRPNLTFKPEVLNRIVNGEKVPLVKTIVRVDVPSYDVDENIGAVLKVISKYPRICSRTDRVKLALAKLLIEIITNGDVNIALTAKTYNVDPTNLRRAYKLALSYKELLGEVRTIISQSRV